MRPGLWKVPTRAARTPTRSPRARPLRRAALPERGPGAAVGLVTTPDYAPTVRAACSSPGSAGRRLPLAWRLPGSTAPEVLDSARVVYSVLHAAPAAPPANSGHPPPSLVVRVRGPRAFASWRTAPAP